MPRFLIFGDLEGKVRFSSIKKIAQKFLNKKDFLVFTGDIYSNPLTLYYRFKKAQKEKKREFYFPEIKIIKELNKKYKILFIYGNKDLRSKLFGLDKLREREVYSIEDFYGEREIENIKFCWLNGSNLVCTDFCEKARKIVKDIDYLISEYEKKLRKSKYKGRIRLKDLPEQEIKLLKKKYGELFELIYTYPYVTNFKWLSKKKSNAEILLTHTPPYCKKAKIIAGNYPDLAIYKKEKKGIIPCFPNDKKAIKENVGLKEITSFIKKNKFKLVICGHIHEGSGIALYKKTLIVNPGSKASFLNKNKVLPFCFLELDRGFKEIKYFLKNWEGDFEGKIRF